jgi:UDP-2,4-diacetamido-2,4,6-trideoxy-beta-L-altropyranose hydrolase
MKVLFRADTGRYHGGGHLFRCLNLARELKSDGLEVIFLSKTHEQHILNVLEGEFEVISIESKMSEENFKDDDYTTWNCESSLEEFQRVQKIVEERNITHLIVDHYSIDQEFDKRVMSELNVKYMVIDDLGRRHHCDILLDQNYGTLESKYSESVIGKLCVGPMYSLLNKNISKLRETRVQNQNLRNVLVFFGVSDKTNEVVKVISALERSPSEKKFHFIVADIHPDYKEIISRIEKLPNVSHTGLVKDFPSLLSEYDLMFGASGATNWERSCLGIPSCVITIADNQRFVAKSLSEEGYMFYIGDGNNTTDEDWIKVLNKIENDSNELIEYGQNSKKLVDGLGVEKLSNLLRNF